MEETLNDTAQDSIIFQTIILFEPLNISKIHQNNLLKFSNILQKVIVLGKEDKLIN